MKKLTLVYLFVFGWLVPLTWQPPHMPWPPKYAIDVAEPPPVDDDGPSDDPYTLGMTFGGVVDPE